MPLPTLSVYDLLQIVGSLSVSLRVAPGSARRKPRRNWRALRPQTIPISSNGCRSDSTAARF